MDNPEPKANTLVDEIVDKVIEKVRGATLEPGNTTSHVDAALKVHDNGINFTCHRGNFRGRQRGQFRGKYRNDFTPQQASKNNRSRKCRAVLHVIAQPDIAKPAAPGATMPGTASLRTTA